MDSIVSTPPQLLLYMATEPCKCAPSTINATAPACSSLMEPPRSKLAGGAWNQPNLNFGDVMGLHHCTASSRHYRAWTVRSRNGPGNVGLWAPVATISPWIWQGGRGMPPRLERKKRDQPAR